MDGGGMSDIQAGLMQWGLDLIQVRERVYQATPRERERWHALWLLAQDWSANSVAVVLDRDAHTSGGWRTAFCEHGPTALVFEQTGGSPALDTAVRVGLNVAVQATPAAVGVDLAHWNWQVVRHRPRHMMLPPVRHCAWQKRSERRPAATWLPSRAVAG